MKANTQNYYAVDLGGWTTKISALRDNKYFQILTNQANFRQTPSIVAFSDAERLIGEAGLIKMKSNFQNSLRAPLRLISLPFKPFLQEQQLRFLTIPYEKSQSGISLLINTKSVCQNGEEFVKLRAQQFLISLLERVYHIIENNKLGSFDSNDKNYWLNVAVPSYFGNGQRKIIKNCAEIAGFITADLIQEYQAIAFEYYFFRIKQLQLEFDPRTIAFIDFGYSKFSVHVCQISKEGIQLIDHEILKCTGARNMDQILLNYYIDKFKKQTGEDLTQNKKAIVKLLDNVQIQRKKLSANNQTLLSIQCILGDYDLSYNMKREELELLVMSFLGELASSMQNLKSRVQPYAKLHSVQIIGGASRMPFFQEIVKNIFNMEVSKTLNTSQTIARGTIIAGTARHAAIHHRIINIRKKISSAIYVCIHSLSKQQPYGKDINQYDMSHKKLVWHQGSEIPSNKSIKVSNKSLTEVLLFSEQNMGPKILGYYQFKEEDQIIFLIDNNQIIRSRLSQKDKFIVYDMDDVVSPQILVKLRENQQKFKKMDQQFNLAYQLRNKYQSQIYSNRQKLSTTWTLCLQKTQQQCLNDVLNECENWLNENGNVIEVQELTQRINSLDQITAFVRQKMISNATSKK